MSVWSFRQTCVEQLMMSCVWRTSGPITGSAKASTSSRVKSRITTCRSEEHTSELQSRFDLHTFPTRRSSDLRYGEFILHDRHSRDLPRVKNRVFECRCGHSGKLASNS